ncbi:STE13 [Candida oxycetoniae]|uniref:STE13 n=1 Tax=Candida oxycetoniae TaxID=497107 RepID=A0AAI9T050_9ASCO|nr:STE13 [Candida oxycetoniae]KAI3405924.2 STE13 [Candida oxycetoniae]
MFAQSKQGAQYEESKQGAQYKESKQGAQYEESKQGVQYEVYEMTQQRDYSQTTTSIDEQTNPYESGENEEEEEDNIGNRESLDSHSSQVFQDLESYVNKIERGAVNDFHNDPVFHSILRKYRKEGVNTKICGVFSLACLAIWISGVILYSQLSPSSILSKVTWQTTVQISDGINITLSEYNPQFRNLTFDRWRSGTYQTRNEEIIWLTEQQFPKSPGGAFYLNPKPDSIVVKQINSNYEKSFLESRKFAYKNNFFYIEEVVLNPSASISDSNTLHLIKTDTSEQWRHSTFALYWLYSPALSTYSPIQPTQEDPRLRNRFLDSDKKEALEKLNYVQFSPDGHYILFAFENDLFVQDLFNNDIQQITQDGSSNIFNGKPDWVYEEEVVATDRMAWWSPDSKRILFSKINDTQVQDVSIDYFVKSAPEIGIQYEQESLEEKSAKGLNQYPIRTILKYPKPGSQNPIITLHVYDVESQKVDLLQDKDETLGKDFILYQATWVDKDNFLMKQTDRTSTILAKKIYRPNESKDIKTVHSANVTAVYGGWVEKMKPMTVIDGELGNKYIDNYVQNGMNYLAVFDNATSVFPSRVFGKFQAISEAVYDKRENYIYFLSNIKSSMDSHLIGINLNSGKYMDLTDITKEGHYSVQFSPNGRLLNLKYNGPDQPWQRLISMAEVHDQFVDNDDDDNDDDDDGHDNDALFTVQEVIQKQPIINQVDAFTKELKTTNLPTVNFRKIKIKKDDVSLSVREILPPNFDPENKKKKKKYPIVVHTYGGPGSQIVFKKFNIDFLQILSSALDAIVLEIEPRGTGGNDWKYKSYAKNKIGYWEARDIKLVTSEYIKANQEFVNTQRVSIWGWSYGGFTTLKTLEHDKGEIFKYGIAIAPVTNWMFYDSIYTERIMNRPSENPNYGEYARINDVASVSSAKRFLLMHGSSDDNVHLQNTMWLIDKLNMQSISNYDLQIFTDSDHDIYYHNAGEMVYGKILHWLQNAFNGKFDNQSAIRNSRLQKDTLEKAKRYLQDQDRIEKLINHWRTVAQMASNYLYNEQSIKFARMGGFKQWQIQEWSREKELAASRLEDARLMLYQKLELELELGKVDEEEKECIMQEFNGSYGLDEEGTPIEEEEEMPDFSDDFTMKNLYKILGLDYELVFE